MFVLCQIFCLNGGGMMCRLCSQGSVASHFEVLVGGRGILSLMICMLSISSFVSLCDCRVCLLDILVFLISFCCCIVGMGVS